jgi:TonB-dependent receptor
MRNALRSLLLAIASLQMVWSIPVNAQGGKGVIAGTVKDSGGSVLTSALVVIQPLGKSAVSNDQGQFRIPDLPAGEYEISATYLGFAAFSQKVTVSAGQTANVDAVLQVASQNDQVIVTAERVQGEAEALNIERLADNIVQVLPAKVITSLPNTNIADAVGRLPSVTLERDEGEGKYVQIRGTEPRLSNLTVDGVNVASPEPGVRNIKLDIIPSDLVDRIEINKTLSANQDADAIGGDVNLVTKTPTNRPTYNFSGLGGYTPIQNGRTLTALTGTIGQRFGTNHKWGVLLGTSYDWNGRGIDDIEPSPGTVTCDPNFANCGSPKTTNTTTYAATTSLDTREYQYYRTRYGFAGGVDYQLAPGSSAYLHGLFSDFHDFGNTWVYTYNAGTLTGQSGGVSQFDPGGSMQYREYIRRPDQQVFTVSTGARHDLTSTLIAYEFAISRGHQIGGFPTTYFNNPRNVAFNVDTSNPRRPKYIVTNGVDIFRAADYSIDHIIYPDARTSQLNFQGSASAARRYAVGSHLGTFEVGFKARNSHKQYNVLNNRYNNGDSTTPPDLTLTLDKYLGTFTNAGYYDKSYQLGPLSDYGKLNSLFVVNPAFKFNESQTHLASDSADYDGNERIIAGYLMNTISFGKLRLQAGVRFEDTDESYTANKVQKDPVTGKWVNPNIPVNGGGNYLNVLPSVQAQYQLTPNTNLRATYGMGISRPNFSDLVPSQLISPNNSPPTISIGNPSLKATRANNYDILIEHFFQPLGIVQAGFFYKDLANPIYNTSRRILANDPQFPTYAGFILTQSVNGPNAHITGFEAAWEYRLSRLPGLLNGFGVSANYSYTTSQVSFAPGFSGGRIDHPSLLRQAPNTWNFDLTYDKRRFSGRFGISHNDANIFAYNYGHVDAATDKDPILGIKGPTGDQYLYAHTQFDVQGSYRLYKGLEVFGYGLNLSNEVFGFYLGSPIYPVQREYYHPTVALGMRWVSSVE